MKVSLLSILLSESNKNNSFITEYEGASTSDQQNDPDKTAQDTDEGGDDAVSSEGEKSSITPGMVEVWLIL